MNQGYNNPEILSMKELEKKYVEYIKEMQRICSIKDNAIVFDIGFEYEIEHDCVIFDRTNSLHFFDIFYVLLF